MILTSVLAGVPWVTPLGRVGPNASRTLSSSSSRASSVAVNVKLFEVSPLSKVMVDGNAGVVPAAVAPSLVCPVAMTGTTTVFSGSSSSSAVTVTLPPSATL